ncbi:MAG: hypothetical protein QOE58_3454 [Actinomycetota bacterium]|jgi:hypothetical protein|nr:hypothetical protein [Actinomycetota bacterium]
MITVCEHGVVFRAADREDLPSLAEDLLVSCTLTLPVEPGRQRRLETALSSVAVRWGLPMRARRWADSASVVLGHPEELEVFVQLDRVSQLLTVEVCSGGYLLFGLDDWVG